MLLCSSEQAIILSLCIFPWHLCLFGFLLTKRSEKEVTSGNVLFAAHRICLIIVIDSWYWILRIRSLVKPSLKQGLLLWLLVLHSYRIILLGWCTWWKLLTLKVLSEWSYLLWWKLATFASHNSALRLLSLLNWYKSWLSRIWRASLFEMSTLWHLWILIVEKSLGC